ncbi:hypothetical protein ZIOFF_000800 [Zingiber officinale]|uniref:C2H2-type domain-containing protein n=1 Tax=Zingiber officinale TaxID=94328 RepID=A0A8J5LY22_ZINOF|nr:hypothetical protein ZIOFF_000800 [Zingiber officinale]
MTAARFYASSSSFLFLLHLACFFLRSRDGDDRTRKRKITASSSLPNFCPPSHSTPNPSKFLSLRSYLGRFLCFRDNHEQQQEAPPPSDSTPIQLIALSPDGSPNGKVNAYVAVSADVAIHPCASCGEVMNKAQLLDLHQATMHSLSELSPSDSGHNIVRIIFESGWRGTSPVIVRRVLKIHHTTRALARYEEYRDAVRDRAGRKGCAADGRCIADGNERLRFYCTTTLCSWDARAAGGVCRNPFCCACAVVRHGFAGKHADLDGIVTHATSWGAHAALPEELEREFAFLGARRTILVCRVVAGRVLLRGRCCRASWSVTRPEVEVVGPATAIEVSGHMTHISLYLRVVICRARDHMPATDSMLF